MPDDLPFPASLDASERVTISHGPHRAEFAPGGGGRLTRLSTEAHDWIVPLAETDWPPAQWPRAGSYPLAPYSNRVRDGVFTFEGARHVLASLPGRPQAIHGAGLYQPWQVRHLADDAVDLVLQQPAGVLGWPWPYECVQRYRLDSRGLSLTLLMINHGDAPMPFGCGIHPYFTATRVALHARRIWPTDADGLPGASQTTHVRELGQSAEGCDTYLSQWGGRATLHWPDGHELALHADPAFAHLVVYTAPGADFLCVEPVTNIADAFNLAAAGETRTGLQVLAPGGRFSASMLLALQTPRAAR
ncbi:aldose 1-epimerase [Achromobacter xylosoxidans]